MSRKLKSYHIAWLSVHPERNQDWLLAKLAEGFDVHHMDGDHLNDDPENLVLIEHVDHMRLHKMTSSYRLQVVRGGGPRGPRVRTITEGEIVYKARVDGASWLEAAKRLNLQRSHAMNRARVYAKTNSLQWPPGKEAA